MWVRGSDQIARFFLGQGNKCKGSRLVPVRANGSQAFGQYRPAADGTGHEPWSLQVIEIEDGRIAAINSFLDTATLFPLFGLPASLH
jgi:RNA polymerase sigma-70 factor (ECF subfamily)